MLRTTDTTTSPMLYSWLVWNWEAARFENQVVVTSMLNNKAAQSKSYINKQYTNPSDNQMQE